MEPVFLPFRRRLRKRLAFLGDVFGKLLATRTPQTCEIRSHEGCVRFCSLITPRHKRSCLSVAGLSILPRFHAAHVNSSLMLSHLPAICSQVTRQSGPDSSRIQAMGLLS